MSRTMSRALTSLATLAFVVGHVAVAHTAPVTILQAWTDSSLTVPVPAGVWTADASPFVDMQFVSPLPFVGFSYALNATPDCQPDTATGVQLSGLPQGSTTFRARGIDSALNCGDVASYEFLIDTVGDPIVDLRAYAFLGGPEILLGVSQTDADPFLTWAVPASTAPILGYSYGVGSIADDDIDIATNAIDLSSLPFGTNLFSVRAIDAAGNVGAAATFQILVEAPGGHSVPSPPTALLLALGIAGLGIFKRTRPASPGAPGENR